MALTRIQKLEKDFQTDVIEELKDLFPGCIVLKNDSSYRQGIPDWIILFQDKWALLEIKRFAKARKQPNQDFYVRQADEMSFGAFIYPENRTATINALQQSFGSGRLPRLPVRQ